MSLANAQYQYDHDNGECEAAERRMDRESDARQIAEANCTEATQRLTDQRPEKLGNGFTPAVILDRNRLLLSFGESDVFLGYEDNDEALDLLKAVERKSYQIWLQAKRAVARCKLDRLADANGLPRSFFEQIDLTLRPESDAAQKLAGWKAARKVSA